MPCCDLTQNLKRDTLEITAKTLFFHGNRENGCAFTLQPGDLEVHQLWEEFLKWVFDLKIPSVMMILINMIGTRLSLALACAECLIIEVRLQTLTPKP